MVGQSQRGRRALGQMLVKCSSNAPRERRLGPPVKPSNACQTRQTRQTRKTCVPVSNVPPSCASASSASAASASGASASRHSRFARHPLLRAAPRQSMASRRRFFAAASVRRALSCQTLSKFGAAAGPLPLPLPLSNLSNFGAAAGPLSNLSNSVKLCQIFGRARAPTIPPWMTCRRTMRAPGRRGPAPRKSQCGGCGYY